ncbi:MAG: hypothetical protein AAF693_06965 [Bacteroidota bacterium]
MSKHKISFCLFLAFSLSICGGVFIEIKAQESELLFEDEVAPSNEKPSENFTPDIPYTEDEKGEKSKKEKGNTKDLKEEEVTTKALAEPEVNIVEKTEEKPVYNPTDPTTTDQDNPLSFNFLYYIIQKFKFADMVDQ